MKRVLIPVTIYFEDQADTGDVDRIAAEIITVVDRIHANFATLRNMYVSTAGFDDDVEGGAVAVEAGEDHPCLSCFAWDCECGEPQQ